MHNKMDIATKVRIMIDLTYEYSYKYKADLSIVQHRPKLKFNQDYRKQ